MFEDCEFKANAYSGVRIEAGGNPTLLRCIMNDNGLYGLYVKEDSGFTLNRCKASGNKSSQWQIMSAS